MLFLILPITIQASHQINKMDLLGSILDSMEKPPEIDEKRKEQMKSSLFTSIFLSNGFCHSNFCVFFVFVTRRAKRAIGKTARL